MVGERVRAHLVAIVSLEPAVTIAGVELLTMYSALVPVGLGVAADRRGAERRTSGVNLVAVIVMAGFWEEDMEGENLGLEVSSLLGSSGTAPQTPTSPERGERSRKMTFSRTIDGVKQLVYLTAPRSRSWRRAASSLS